MNAINYSAPVIASQSTEIDASLEEIWELLTCIEKWPTWNAAITHISIKHASGPGTIFKWTSGTSKITSTINLFEKNSEFGWTGKFMGITAIHQWKLRRKKGKVMVVTAESMDGVFARLFKTFLQRQLDKVLAEWLKSLKNAAEEGIPNV